MEVGYKEFRGKIAQQAGVNSKETDAVIKAMFDVLADITADRGNVTIRGVGKFKSVVRSVHTPFDGGKTLENRIYLRFVASPVLRDKVQDLAKQRNTVLE